MSFREPSGQRSVEEQLQAKLKELAGEITSELSKVDALRGKELLSDFVSDLFLCAAEQRRKEENRQKQAAGIAAAKARGVRFGRACKPLPDNFDEVHRAWREGQMPLGQAADACGMARSTFYEVAMRREQTAG